LHLTSGCASGALAPRCRPPTAPAARAAAEVGSRRPRPAQHPLPQPRRALEERGVEHHAGYHQVAAAAVGFAQVAAQGALDLEAQCHRGVDGALVLGVVVRGETLDAGTFGEEAEHQVRGLCVGEGAVVAVDADQALCAALAQRDVDDADEAGLGIADLDRPMQRL